MSRVLYLAQYSRSSQHLQHLFETQSDQTYEGRQTKFHQTTKPKKDFLRPKL